MLLVASSLIAPDDTWMVWAVLVCGVACCIHLEQTRTWAAKASGPVLLILLGIALSNTGLMPTESPVYDVVEGRLVAIAVALLLFRANVLRIFRKTGPMFAAFHVAAVGSVLGALLAGILFGGSVARTPEVAGIMASSYIGGSVNFMAMKSIYDVPSELTNPLIVADNMIMAAIFGVLFWIATSDRFRKWYPRSAAAGAGGAEGQLLAAAYWRRKEISLLDLAKALAIAVAIVAVAAKGSAAIRTLSDSRLLASIFGNPYLAITLLTVVVATVFSRHLDAVNGPEEIGAILLYLFLFVLGLHADLIQVIANMPVLFGFCLLIAVVNLTFTLLVGRALRLSLEELLLAVNATLGGAPSVAAMAISKGWSGLVLPSVLAAVWGYAIGTFLGVVVTEALKRM